MPPAVTLAGPLAAGAPDVDTVGADLLKSALRLVSATVSVVTAGDCANRTGATVTSATALSVEPPTMVVNIDLSSSTWPVIARHRHFCVNILDASQKAIAENFSGRTGLRGPDRYIGAQWRELASGAPTLVDALAAIDCKVEEIIERHSHAILLGRVMAISLKDGSPLLYGRGQYGTMVG